MSKTREDLSDSDVEIIEEDEGEDATGRHIAAINKELKRMRYQVERLKSEKHNLIFEVKVLKEKMTKLENGILPSASGSWSSRNLLEAFRSVYEEIKRISIRNYKPVELVNSWRGIVDEAPEVAWPLHVFSYYVDYSRAFYVFKYGVHCFVSVERAETVGSIPRLSVELDFEKEVEHCAPPAIIVVVKGKSYTGEVKIYTERQNNFFRRSRTRFCYGRTSVVELVPHICASLEIEIYLERPWSACHTQSHNGILFWTVENFAQLFRDEDCTLYSPYFCTAPNAFRMQALLFVSNKNLLTLFVIKQNDDEAEPPDCLITATVLRPSSKPKRLSFVMACNFRSGQTMTLGTAENIVENDTFLCKVKVVPNYPI